MPWKAQVCPFCQKEYANKTGLRTHLGWYTGTWRIPADGVHDVVQIDKTLHESKRAQPEYQCPSCSVIMNSRRHFIEHVFYRNHYPASEGEQQQETKGKRRNKLPFDPDAFKIPQRKGPFRFLDLPFDIRHMIYKFIFFFDKITFHEKVNSVTAKLNRQGIWLQHNPPNNPLALLAASRQTYHEGRRVFYGLNSFIFSGRDSVPIFLIGIGRENAALLRSVQWKNEQHQHESLIDVIRPYLGQEGTSPEEKQDIWNDDRLYSDFLGKFIDTSYWSLVLHRNHRLMPLDATRTSSCYRMRYMLNVAFGDDTDGCGSEESKKGVASFELYVQSELIDHQDSAEPALN